MTKTLIRSVYLDGVHLAPGTELTDEQAERVTNPHATEDLSVKGQDGREAVPDNSVKTVRASADNEDTVRKAAAAKTNR